MGVAVLAYTGFLSFFPLPFFIPFLTALLAPGVISRKLEPWNGDGTAASPLPSRAGGFSSVIACAQSWFRRLRTDWLGRLDGRASS